MKKMIYYFLLVCIVSLLGSCNIINNAFTYKDISKEFVNDVLKKDYTAAANLFELNHDSIQGIPVDSFKSNLSYFRKGLVSEFGDKLDFTFMSTEKDVVGKSDFPPNSTVLYLQYNNEKYFGVFEVVFDDQTKKILDFKILQIKDPIPGMLGFWLFGLLAICIPIFNIYVIIKIIRSKMKRKWLGYLAVIIFNVPEIIYNAVDGFSFNLLSFKILLGIGFSFEGYLNSNWAFGIPLGGLFMLWWLRNKVVETLGANLTAEEPIISGDENIDPPAHGTNE